MDARSLLRRAFSLGLTTTLCLWLGTVGGLLTWAWHTETGSQWVLNQLPGVKVQQLQGALGAESLRAGRVELTLGADHLTLDDLALHQLQWHWRPHSGAWLGLTAGQVTATRVTWRTGPTEAPSSPPTDLQLPLLLLLPQIDLQELQVDDLPALGQVQASASLGADQGQRLQLHLTHARTDRFKVQGDLSLGTVAPLPLRAELILAGLPAGSTNPPWQAQLKAEGPLADLALSGQLDGNSTTARARADLQVRVRPFAAWPLGDLKVQTRDLDLSSLHSQAPITRLDLQASLHTDGLNQPARASISLSNPPAGRWDQHRLPIRRLEAKLSGTPQPLHRLTLDQLKIDWGPAERSAGQWSGTGLLGWSSLPNPQNGLPEQARLQLQWRQWQPQALGLPSPDLNLSGQVELGWQTAPLQHFASPQLSLLARLTGPSPGTATDPAHAKPDAMSLVVDASGSRQQLTVRELSLQTSTSSLRVNGQVSHSPASRWAWQVQADAQTFDPRPWWPATLWPQARPWAPALTAHLESQASLPDQAWDTPAMLMEAWRGHLSLQVTDTLVAGLPVQGTLHWQTDETAQTLRSHWQLQDTTAQLDWKRHTPPGADAQPENRARAQVDIPQLQTLAPWLKLLMGPQAGSPSGTLKLQADLDQSTPKHQDWRWQLDAQADAVHLGSAQIGHARAQGTGGWRLDAPLSASLQASHLGWEPARLTELQARLGGSLADHTFAVDVSTPLRPPAWLERLIGGRQQGHQAHAAGQGRLTMSDDDSWLWQGRQLTMSARSATNGEPWLTTTSLAPSIQGDREHGLRSIRVPAGELTLKEARWTWGEAHYQPAHEGTESELDLVGQLQPLHLAPWLSRLQPDTAWGGDLQVGGQFALHRHAGAWDADMALERLGGDLSVDEDGQLATSRRQALGLSALRIALTRQADRWLFSQALAGQYVGALSSVVQASVPPTELWPRDESPVEGSLNLRVVNLGAWATWLPAGWRLGGQLESQSRLTGRWGAPELSGSLDGQQLSVRNTLLGVAYDDGQLRLLLNGPQARLERFQLKTSDGLLSATGQAQLGAQPQGTIDLKATRFKALQRLDRQLTLSGLAQLQLAPTNLSLTGDLKVDDGLIDVSRGDAPTLADDVVVLNSQVPSEAGAEPHNGTANRLKQLAVTVDLGQRLRLKGQGIDTGLQGTLRFGQNRGQLDVQGPVSTVGGTYAAYGQKLSMDRGVILFTGPLNDPRLDIYAIRPDIDARVGVTVTGSALNPRVRLASDSDMTDTERLSWLVMGRAPEGLGQADTALLQRAALALLTTDGRSPTLGLLDSIGLTDFGLRQATDSNNVQTTVVSLGKQLSRRWYVGYERSVNATAGSWQLIYRVAQRFTIRAQSGEESALDGIWVWRWD